MSISDTQKQLLSAMKLVAEGTQQNNGPVMKVGVVAEDPEGYKCIVNIQGTEKECVLPEHLHDWISKDDIVYVTDLYGNEAELMVSGSSGSTRKQSLVVNDENKNKLVGGVTKFEDNDGTLTDNYLTIE